MNQFVSEWLDKCIGPNAVYIRRTSIADNRIYSLMSYDVSRALAEGGDEEIYRQIRESLIEDVTDAFEASLETGEAPWDWMMFSLVSEDIRRAQEGDSQAQRDLVAMICESLVMDPWTERFRDIPELHIE